PHRRSWAPNPKKYALPIAAALRGDHLKGWLQHRDLWRRARSDVWGCPVFVGLGSGRRTAFRSRCTGLFRESVRLFRWPDGLGDYHGRGGFDRRLDSERLTRSTNRLRLAASTWQDGWSARKRSTRRR